MRSLYPTASIAPSSRRGSAPKKKKLPPKVHTTRRSRRRGDLILDAASKKEEEIGIPRVLAGRQCPVPARAERLDGGKVKMRCRYA